MTGVCVLTTAKDEGAFLLEWVAHHLALGASALVICTNDCADGTDAMADRLQALGLATHHRTRVPGNGASIQRAAFRQVRARPEIAGAGWLWVCDIDEFLVIRPGEGRFADLIAAASPEAECISVPWRVFGPGGRRAYAEGPVTRQFPRGQAPARRGAGAAVFAKSLFRPSARVERIGVHGPVPAPGVTLMREAPGGRPLPRPGQLMMVRADYRVAQVNHYALRAGESFLVKRARGRVNHVGQDMGADYWRRFDIAEVEDDAIRRYDAAAQAHLARLMADPPLAALHRAAVAWHRARIAALLADPLAAALLDQLCDGGASCASLPS
jgi:hypothetical protein